MNTSYLIVVGMDGSEGGRRALDWAANEAATRGGAVQAVVAWSWDGMDYGPIAATYPQQEAERARELIENELKALAQRRGSRLPVSGEAVEGRPADVLTAAGRSADLLVLGSHGHSRLRHTVLGSVSEECIRYASCPVVVIPVPAERQEPVNEPALRS
jgi:nucleotide-binding universal stress UspA family protein